MGVDTQGRSKIVGLDMTRIVQARSIDSTSLVLALGLEEVAPARPHLELFTHINLRICSGSGIGDQESEEAALIEMKVKW